MPHTSSRRTSVSSSSSRRETPVPTRRSGKPRKKHRLLPLFFLLLLFAGGWWFRKTYLLQGFHRLPNVYKEPITQITSSLDRDGDGIDDQTDILQGTIAYLSTNPIYESRYYTNGYPDDEYGVCTDVVAFALLRAGYDLKALVAKDIAAHPEDYDIDIPDPNIDFRRVRNLKVFFSHCAIKKATDFADIRQWQGGDIVIFTDHIGMVSDHRNARGIPYVLHNGSPTQLGYEQDILESRNDIEGHYRMSE